MYTPSSGWFPFAFTLPDYGIFQTYGDASSVQLYRTLGYDASYDYHDGCG